MCVLLERLLYNSLPGSTFRLRLGSLHVVPEDDNTTPIVFDPRGPDGIDGGFHAWLGDSGNQFLDPSIHPTLAYDGFDVDADCYYVGDGGTFARDGLIFVYEELPDLQLLGREQSEPHLARLMALALTGKPQMPGTIYLDVGWRSHDALCASQPSADPR